MSESPNSKLFYRLNWFGFGILVGIVMHIEISHFFLFLVGILFSILFIINYNNSKDKYLLDNLNLVFTFLFALLGTTIGLILIILDLIKG